MLAHPTLDQLHTLGLYGLAKGFKELEHKAEARVLDHAEWLGLLLEYELTLRRQKQFETRARVGPRRQDRHAVMVGELPVAAVQSRLVSIRIRDRRLQIVADHKLRRAAEKGEQIDVRADPVGDLLARPRLSEDVARRAHDRDEPLHRPNLARHWVDDVDRVAGKIDEDLFVGGVALAHARPQPALERSVVLAKPALPEPVRMCGAVFLPQERHGHALAAHLLVDERPIGLRTSARGLGGRRRREQQTLQRPVVQVGRLGPVLARQTSPLEIRVNRPIAEQQGTPDLALAQPASEPQTQNIADFPHRQSPCYIAWTPRC